MTALATEIFPASELSQKKAESLGSTLGGMLGGIPRGTLTEIAGPGSSGRTSLLCGLLAEATSEDLGGSEFCALIDASDTFDPVSAAGAGVRLSQLLWVRCGGNAEHAMKAADLLTQAGGFGMVAIDLADMPPRVLQRIPLASWYRLRQAVDNTRTALVSVGSYAHTSSCPALKIELIRKRIAWRGREPVRLLEGFEALATRIRNHRSTIKSITVGR
jgi:recombination protein RecA